MRYLLALAVTLLLSQPILASETRGLRVVAKDAATGQSGEVKLYNKSYAVVIRKPPETASWKFSPKSCPP